MSGLAYGVDIHCHRNALECGMETIGVLAHGLDTIYPALHRNTAAQMAAQGGLLTEYMSRTRPDKGNFVRRNRIIAGMSLATVVIESADKGGSLITARLANDYGRTVCAFPGRATDTYSKGCNQLINSQRAVSISSAKEFIDAIGWISAEKHESKQLELFPLLDETEQAIYDQLNTNESLSINQLTQTTALPFAKVSATLYELEEKKIVRMTGGNRYQIIRHL